MVIFWWRLCHHQNESGDLEGCGGGGLGHSAAVFPALPVPQPPFSQRCLPVDFADGRHRICIGWHSHHVRRHGYELLKVVQNGESHEDGRRRAWLWFRPSCFIAVKWLLRYIQTQVHRVCPYRLAVGCSC
jgi:hypothetical protein